MSVELDTADSLDVTGLNCPMPIVRAKQEIDRLDHGTILAVKATDPGSMPDFEGWAESTPSVELLEQIEAEENGETVYTHFVRKVDA